MPAKKAKTTLVTEDQLIEAVTSKVKESMKEELDTRFGQFERALERLTGPERPPQNPLPLQQHDTQAPPTESGNTAPATTGPAHLDVEPHSTFNAFPIAAPPTAPAQTPLAAPQQVNHQRMRQPAATATSGVNNNTSTWDHWFTPARPMAAYQGAAAAAPFNTRSAYDAVIDAQVRHIMESTPHQLTGTVTAKKYPFNYVTRGPEKKKLSFNTLTLAEHIFGLFCMIDDPEIDPATRPNLVAHMREVAEDASEFEWPNVRRWSEEVFSLLADRRLTDGWGDKARIQNLRTGMSRIDAARLHFHKDNNPRRFPSSANQSDNLRGGPPCQDFNGPNGCNLQSGHMMHGRRQVHVCAYCLNNTAAVHPHSEQVCRTKQKHSNYHF